MGPTKLHSSIIVGKVLLPGSLIHRKAALCRRVAWPCWLIAVLLTHDGWPLIDLAYASNRSMAPATIVHGDAVGRPSASMFQWEADLMKRGVYVSLQTPPKRAAGRSRGVAAMKEAAAEEEQQQEEAGPSEPAERGSHPRCKEKCSAVQSLSASVPLTKCTH